MKHITFISSLLMLCLAGLSFASPNSLDSLTDTGPTGLSSGFESNSLDILPPEEAFHISAELIEAKTLRVHFEVAPNIYLYREQFGFIGTNGARLGVAELPPGQPKQDLLGQHEVYYHEVDAIIPILATSGHELTFDVAYQGCSDQGFCYPPSLITLNLNLQAAATSNTQGITSDSIVDNMVVPSTIPPPLENAFGTAEHDKITQLILGAHKGWIILVFLGFGLLLTFTPCVLPMVPILSSIIIGQGQTITKRRAFGLALTYVMAMAITYTLAGIVVGLAGHNLQILFQKPGMIILFSLLFILLALSMFGFYELRLPARFEQRLTQISRHQQRGRYISSGILGVISALVVSPCITPPLVGALAYIGQTGDAMLGGIALFSLGLGMGLPLLLGATFGAQFLPKAGAWMATVKAIFGVLLLGVAVWLLARIVPGPVELVLWAALLMVSAIYLGAFDSAKQSWARLWKGIACLLFVYSVLLLIGAALGHDNPLQPLGRLNQMNSSTSTPSLAAQQVISIKSFSDLNNQLIMAGLNNKPVMLDFYADWCVSCIIMRRTTFVDPQVQQRLQDFIVLEADVTANDTIDIELQRHFGIYGPPAILFFTPGGEEIKAARIVGEMSAVPFYNHITQITERLP